MNINVRIIKPFRYGIRVFEIGEEGTIVPIAQIEHPLEWKGKSIYDYYVRFDNHIPIGVRKEEIEIIEGTCQLNISCDDCPERSVFEFPVCKLRKVKE